MTSNRAASVRARLKQQALCILGMTNSRMKDYFDRKPLLHDSGVDGAELRRAVTATFDRRQFPVPAELPIGLSDAFAADLGKQTQSAAFRRKNRLDALDLGSVVHRIRDRAAMIGIPAR